jgi:hypothetical protein
MMEPTYTYVKGEGWVPEIGHLATDCHGVKIRVFCRKPSIGEAFFVCSDNGEFGTPDQPNVARGIKYFVDNGIDAFLRWNDDRAPAYSHYNLVFSACRE